mmetsp:Transcript_25747/g.65467  ORF Transcript_25747/g.65467 Transcript_25747/m.65467 type:complete len:502 (-) Transcript_25747:932-2437(-)
MGMPMMMDSLTPTTASQRPWMAASNRWSAVFSKLAVCSTLSFILAIPKRVMPSTSPLYVMQSASSPMWRSSMDMPCEPMVYWISLLMAVRAASMPRQRSTSATWLVTVWLPSTPAVAITRCRSVPSTSSMCFSRPVALSLSLEMTARATVGMPTTITFGSTPSSCCRLNSRPCLESSGGMTSTLSTATARTCCSLSLMRGCARMASLTVVASMSSCSASTVSMSSRTLMAASPSATPRLPGRSTTLMWRHTWPSSVRSSRPLTMRADLTSLSTASATFMMGVEMFLAALMISLMRGTPSVTFMDATPAKWNVLSVICVPGSPMDCAPTAPTVEPGSMRLDSYLDTARSTNDTSCEGVSPDMPAAYSSASSPRAASGSPSRSRACLYAATCLERNVLRPSRYAELHHSTPTATAAPGVSPLPENSLRASCAATALDSCAGSCTSVRPPSVTRLRRVVARTLDSRRSKSSGCPSLPSIVTGSMPSSPYRNCTMPPAALRTVRS